ncbi:MAG: class I SAM-dependent methyltransferase [Rhodobacteraceae bacterium]|nr:class I SAM-dependent methyltransferase [Paracoccaceae bacterium]
MQDGPNRPKNGRARRAISKLNPWAAKGDAHALSKRAPRAPKIKLLYPIGHFYSPIANPEDIAARRDRIFARKEGSVGIDYNVDAQLALLSALAPYVTQIDYPVDKPDDARTYFYGNTQFPVLDAEFLFTALCHFRPKAMIEVGSGYSSLITADVNRRILNGSLSFSCVEPYPHQFLVDGVDGITDLVMSKVEDLDLSFFDRLGDGDILFIDSSHVSKVGSDVNYLFFEVIPRLKPGVMVHIHDIFLPDDYPEIWALDQNRNWNEQYLLHAFLQFNSEWKVMWSSHLMGTRHGDEVTKVFPRYPELGGGGSLWMRRN